MHDTLPTRPDPSTGEPFPPHAPAFTGNTVTLQQVERYKPSPPDGMSEPLAWYQETPRGKVSLFFLSLILTSLGGALISLSRGDGFGDSLTYWQVWIFILVLSLLIASPSTVQTQSAGADWFQWNYRRWYTRSRAPRHIRTYDLVKVEAWASGYKVFLDLTDRDGNTCRKMRHDLQQQRHIWDLLYNGIAHSVANGAQVNKMSLNLLELAKTPALQIRVEKEKNCDSLPNQPTEK